MDEEKAGQISKEEQERADIQSKAEKFVKDHAGYCDQEELERWTAKYQSLSSEEQQKERDKVTGRLEASVDKGKFEHMGLEFAMLASAGKDFDTPARLSYVNRTLAREMTMKNVGFSQYPKKELYTESFRGEQFSRLGKLQEGLDLMNKLLVVNQKAKASA